MSTEVGYFTNKPIEAEPINFHQVHRMPYYGDDCIIIGFTTWNRKIPQDITMKDYRNLCNYYAGPWSCFDVTGAEVITDLPEGTRTLPNFRKEYLRLNIAPKPLQGDEA